MQEYWERAGYEAGKLLRSLKEKAAQWWYFLDHPEVPPDNNLADATPRRRKTQGVDGRQPSKTNKSWLQTIT